MTAFYIFILIVTLLLPATMILFGYQWRKNPPPKINHSYGYRTKRSMSSKEAWDFAHRHCGRAWGKLGWFTLVLSIAAMVTLPFISLEIVVVSAVGLIIVFLQMIPLCVPLISTERALKREFKI